MVERRLGLPVVLVVIGLVALVVRLFEVQVVQHEVWAREAANLLRSSAIVPYHRGAILDAQGRVLVRDEDVHEVELCYRDFRRHHPLGQVAHGWSSLTRTATSLVDAHARRVELALALVSLTPAELEAFATGAAIERLGVPTAQDRSLERRGARASDVRYYVTQLCDLSRRGRRTLRELAKTASERERSYLELASRAEPSGGSWQERERALADRLQRVGPDLERLAILLGRPDPERTPFDLAGAAAQDVLTTPELALVAELEGIRRDVEDEMADELFELAAGFPPGRLTTESLLALDLTWMAAALRWDEERTFRWRVTRRSAFREWLETFAVERALVEVELEGDRGRRPERLLDELAAIFTRSHGRDRRDRRARRGEGWRDLDQLAVLADLDELVEVAGVPGLGKLARDDGVLPFQDPVLRARGTRLDWTAIDGVLALPGADPVAWSDVDATGWLSDAGRDSLRDVVVAWDERLALVCQAALEARVPAASGAQASALAAGPYRLPFAPGRLERAAERERYVLRDRSSRPRALESAPGYDAIHLLARHVERYAGFAARDATRRRAVALNEDGTPVAGLLIGSVRRPDLFEILEQKERKAELSALKRKRTRTPAEERRIVELSAGLVRPGAFHGGQGLEVWLDDELRGRNGYRETDGLQEREDGPERGLFQPPVDGQALRLTLDLDLQRAAQDVLAHPERDAEDPAVDDLWLQNPVGAIVMITPEGDVLAAASEPTSPGIAPAARLSQRANAAERTLQRHTANAPGSTFKPFVAAWALDRLGLDPERRWLCAHLPGGGYGYATMHCTGLHNEATLNDALRMSCNAYFAHLGEELYTPAEVRAMAEVFGFGRPTGVRPFEGHSAGDGRQGFTEHYGLGGDLERALERTSVRMMATNGLGPIDVTPAQVARATAGLATGRLPRLRLVRSIGDVEVPVESERLPLREENLAIVRAAMQAVVTGTRGSALNKGLDRESLGFTLAVKTGSADYAAFRKPSDDPSYGTGRSGSGRRRKHTWVTGWFPAEAPRAIVTLYLHDSAETSSHTAVYLARQFLKTDAVRAWLVEQGVDLTGGLEDGR